MPYGIPRGIDRGMNALMAFPAPYQGAFKRKCVSPMHNKRIPIICMVFGGTHETISLPRLMWGCLFI